MARPKTENSESKRINFATPEEHAFDDDSKGARIVNGFVVREQNSSGDRSLVVRRPALTGINLTLDNAHQATSGITTNFDLLNIGNLLDYPNSAGEQLGYYYKDTLYWVNNTIPFWHSGSLGTIDNGVGTVSFSFGSKNSLIICTGRDIYLLVVENVSTVPTISLKQLTYPANIMLRSTSYTRTTNGTDFTFYRPSSSAANGFLFRLSNSNINGTYTTAASEPTWNCVLGQTTQDGSAVWECCGYDPFVLDVMARSTQYYYGDVVYVLDGSDGEDPREYVYRCTTEGTTAATAPGTWGTTTTDGTVVWTRVTALTYFMEPTTPWQYPVPKGHVSTPVVLDGMVFLPVLNYTKDSSNLVKSYQLYNSDVNYPWSWNAVNYVVPDQLPDDIIGLGRQNNLLVVFGTQSIEFFRNAGNTTGSPLQRQDGYTIQFGCCDAGTIQTQESTMFWVSEHDSGGRTVWKADGVSPKKISTPYIEKAIGIDKYISTKSCYSTTAISSNTTIGSFWKSNLLKYNGKTFYVLLPTVDADMADIDFDDLTAYLYDVDLDLWYEWKSRSASCFVTSQVYSSGSVGMDISNTTIEFREFSKNGDDVSEYQTLSPVDIPVTVTLTSPVFTNGTQKRKFIDHLTVMQSTSPAADANLKLRWSDDNYTTWSSWITLDASTRCYIPRGGSFRRRAYQLEYTGSYAKWFEYLEADITNGVN